MTEEEKGQESADQKLPSDDMEEENEILEEKAAKRQPSALGETDLEDSGVGNIPGESKTKGPSTIRSSRVSETAAPKSSRRIELSGSAKKKRRSPKFFVGLGLMILLGLIFAGGIFVGARKPAMLSFFRSGKKSEPTRKKRTKSKPKEEATLRVDKAAVELDVLNGNGTKGESAGIANILKQAGWNVVNVTNADNFNYAQTQVRFKAGFEDAGKLVAREIATSYPAVLQQVLGADSKADVVVVLGKDKKASGGSVVRILNGNGKKGSAQEVAEILKKNGFQIKEMKNADKFDYPESVISYKPGKKDAATNIASQIASKYSANLKEDASLDVDIVILLGMK